VERNRALITAAVAVVVIGTATVVAAVDFGLVRREDEPLPGGEVDLATVMSSATVEPTSSSAGPIRVEVVDGMVHIYEADGSVVTVPLPTDASTTTATRVDEPGSDD
jgi:hypothetical protein